jgi:hypothetical protein
MKKIINTILFVFLFGIGLARQTPVQAEVRLTNDTFSEVQILRASDAQEGDFLGGSMAQTENLIAVAAHLEDGGNGDPLIDAGAVYLYSRDEGGAENWGEIKTIRSSEIQADDFFGGVSLALSDQILVAGSYKENGGPGDPLALAGAAYIFEKDAGGPDNWGQVKKLTPNDLQPGDEFGRFISLSGDILAVAAKWEDGGIGDPKPDSGAVYIFYRDQGGADNWGQVAKITAGDSQSDDWFGNAIDLQGSTLVVGALLEDGGPGDPANSIGALYIFEKDQGGTDNWGEVKKFVGSDSQADDFFGNDFSLDGDYLAVGAVLEDGGPGDPIDRAGAVYVFERDLGGSNNWGERIKIVSSEPQDNDQFGFKIHLEGETLLVGSQFEDGGLGDPLNKAGAMYLFERDEGGQNNWGEVAKLVASDMQADDELGHALSILGDTLAGAAHREDGGAGDPIDGAGSIYIFGAPPTNDDFANPIAITNLVYSNTQHATYATTEAQDPILPCGGNQKSQSVWYTFTPPSNGFLNISTKGSNYSVISAVWSGTQGSLVNQACYDGDLFNVPLVGGVAYSLEFAARDLPALSRELAISIEFGTELFVSNLFLPAVLRNAQPCYPGDTEIEPNDQPDDATGLLCAPTTLTGLPDDDRDYYSFQLGQAGQITIDLLNHPLEPQEGAQLQLFFGDVSNLVAADILAPYKIEFSGQVGDYLLLVFTDQSKCNGNCGVPYQLIFDFPTGP